MQFPIERHFITARIVSSHGNERKFYIVYLASMAMILSILEYMIPKPLPWLKIGLANAITLYSFGVLRDREVMTMVFVRVTAVALMLGTIISTTFLLSLTSAVSSFLAMWIAIKIFRKVLSVVGISVIGAVASNLSQLIVVNMLFIKSNVSYYIVPILLLTALVGGIITGLFAGFLKNNI